MIEITENMLDTLRENVMKQMSVKRFRHTVAVEEMVLRLSGLYCPDQTMQLRAAALLHDITKECSTEEQIALCERYGLSVSAEDRLAPKTFHARTAAAIIPTEYPMFADPTVISAVRWHTTGRADMTLTEKLLYLADYIDASRSFENCVILRRFFWGARPEEMTADAKNALLRDTLILSYRMTMEDLLADGTPIAPDTVEARNQLLLERQ
ncbi:MAG: bis(5'-nucleosyl)-tetraphosphatase (symmetrical) YqeK [Clostridia bacterium]|nr:bis(5'-nucleosyl)-tetraphosphatase (symmetrical) YqeK [Clostridia bacterium]